jgi:integrase
MQKNLTDRTLQALKPAAKTYDVWDTQIPAFGVRVSDSERLTFVLAMRKPGSKHPTRRALGSYPALTLAQARAKASQWIELVKRGIDPAVAEEEARQAALRQQANTFAAVAEDYLRLHVIGRQRKADVVARNFRSIFMALWGMRPITSITRHDVLTLIEDIRDNGTAAALGGTGKAPAPVQARNLLTNLKTFFGWAIERGAYGLESSPCDHIKASRVIGERQSSDRTLDDGELRALWQTTGTMSYPFGPCYRLLLLTGLRLNEVADATWNEFDLPKGIWTIPASRMKGKNGKARPHTVPLTADMLAILEHIPRFNGGPHLFSFTNGRTSVNMSNRVKDRLDAAMTPKAPWVNHDIRRTVRSRLSELRVPADVAEAILAHAKPGIRGVYDRYEHLDEKRAALELWAQRLHSIIA